MDLNNFFISLLPKIEHLSWAGYWLISLIFFLDSLAFVGITVPGTVIIILIGFLTGKGLFELKDVVWFVSAGAVLGDLVSYYLGSHAKKIFRPESRIFKSSYLLKGKSFFHIYGGRSVFLGRFIGPIRPIIPFVAGLFRMNKEKFFIWNILSGVSWSMIFLILGYLFGQAWQIIILWSTRVSIFVGLLSGIFIAFYFIKWVIDKKGKQFFNFFASVFSSVKQAVISNPEVKKLVARHSFFFRILKNRLNKNRFFGLPLTLLFLSFVYVLTLFAGIIEDVVRAETIVMVDDRLANLLAYFRTPLLVKIFFWITLLGKWQIIFIFSLATIVFLCYRKRWRYILPMLVTSFGSYFFVWLGKIAFHRSRPDIAVYLEKSYSFPSGHAAIAVAFYGFLMYLLIRQTTKWKSKVNFFFVGLIVILLIGFSRLYLGVHYLSDVWGGYLVGLLWLIIGISISEALWYGKKFTAAFKPRIVSRVTALAFLLFAVAFYVGMGLNYNPQREALLSTQATVVSDINSIFSSDQFKYTETLSGSKQEPVSFVILADSDDSLIKQFVSAGWYLADATNFFSVAKLAGTALLQRSYLRAPMTPSFWNTQVHDFGFEKPTSVNNVHQRHHARFWRTKYQTAAGKQVYVGTASLDSGLKWGVTHKINPNIDAEREFLFTDLLTAGVVSDFSKIQLVSPSLGKNFGGDIFFTDGKCYIISFR